MKTILASLLGAALLATTVAAPASAGFKSGPRGFHGHKFVSHGHRVTFFGHGHGCFIKKVKIFDHHGGFRWTFVRTCG